MVIPCGVCRGRLGVAVRLCRLVVTVEQAMIVDRLVGGFRNTTYRNPEQWLIDWFGGAEVDSGVRVGPNTAMSYGPYYQAVQLISGDIGKIPLPLYKRTP